MNVGRNRGSFAMPHFPPAAYNGKAATVQPVLTAAWLYVKQPIMSPRDTLKDWLGKAEISAAEFARRVEYDRSNFHRLLKGDLWPSLDLAHRIEQETGGDVKMSAWAEAKAAVQDRAA